MLCCLQTSSIYVLANGSLMEEFAAQKGLCQGDSLAPFLFLVVADGLIGLIREEEDINLLSGMQFGDTN